MTTPRVTTDDRGRHVPELLSDLLDGVDGPDEALVSGTERLSWASYAERVGRLATVLLDAGVTPGDRVAVHLHKSAGSFVAAHAVLRAGGVMVPVDANAPVPHVAAAIVDAGADVVVTDTRADALADLVQATGISTAVCNEGPGGPVGCQIVGPSDVNSAPVADVVRVDPDDPAYIIYTSGSTGAPKGIVHTHRSALAYAHRAVDTYDIGSEDRLANIAPLHFDQSTFELYAAPLAGATALVVPEPVLRFPASLSSLIADERVTVWYSVPFLLEQLAGRGALAERDLSALRWVLNGGEAFPPDRLAALMKQLPGVRFSNVYGPAEVNQCTYFHLDDPPTGDEPVPIGRAWAGTDLAVVDDGDVPVSPGQPGELLVSTPTMMAGYWRRAEADGRVFARKPDGTEPGRRWYATGDLVHERADGELVFLGRADNQVKVRGHRIELEAVDAALSENDGVAEAITVVDRADDAARLVALVVPAEGADFDDGALRAGLGRRLPRYAVPDAVRVVSSLPRTSSGKLDRGAARTLLDGG